MKSKPLFSIIIPVRKRNAYLKETLTKIKQQTLKSYEVLVITDKISASSRFTNHQVGPGYKRNLGARMAKGKYLAFLDDDSYPDKYWLENALKTFRKHPDAAAVCGPCLTPEADDLRQKASGFVWSNWIGSGGAGVYRNSISQSRNVDDYPTVNLMVKKSDFWKIDGFDNRYWPGEDTILCLNIVNKLKKKIKYHPSIMVFHHRRQVIIPHLQQITRYAIHRGHFAKKFPQTSFRLGYILPSLFSIYITGVFLFDLLNLYTHRFGFFITLVVNLPLHLYMLILLATYLINILKTRQILSSVLAMITVPLTHYYYGWLFLYGFSKKNIQFTPHHINSRTGEYIGG